MTNQAAIETVADVFRSQWAVHILGADDVLPALSRLDAYQRAHKANKTILWLEGDRRQDPLTDPLLPLTWAVPHQRSTPLDMTAAEVEAAWKEWERG